MTRPSIRYQTWNRKPGIRRYIAVAKQLPPHRVIFGTISLLVSYALGVFGVGAAAYIAVDITSRALSTTPNLFALVASVIGVVIIIAFCSLFAFMWGVSLILAWPPEQNRLAKALTGSSA